MFAAPTAEQIVRVMNNKNYAVFSNPKGHDLNIVGIRTHDFDPGKFNDWLTVFYIYDGIWNYFAFPATTDPGTYYRLNPISVKGTAVLKPGQYRSAYKIGRHRNYKALEQIEPVTVYRDANRDKRLDTTGMLEDTGLHAINIHRSNAYKPSTVVGRWSAGCQVVQDPDHFQFLLILCERGREKYGNSFTYTLLEERDFATV